MVVISGVQTAKLSSLQTQGVKAVTNTAASNSGGAGNSNLPASLQNLPAQVGGC